MLSTWDPRIRETETGVKWLGREMDIKWEETRAQCSLRLLWRWLQSGVQFEAVTEWTQSEETV